MANYRSHRLEDWNPPVSPLVFMVSLLGVGAAESIFGMSCLVQSGKFKKLNCPTPSLDEWHACYKRPHQSFGILVDYFLPAIGVSRFGLWQEFVLEFRNLRGPPEAPERVQFVHALIELARDKKLMETLREARVAGARDLEEEIRAENEPLTKEANEYWCSVFKIPESQFFFRVTLLCYLEYGIHPTILFRRARNGDLTSLEKLIVIDRSVLMDSYIAENFHACNFLPETEKIRRIHRAFAKGYKKKITLKRIKIRLSAFLLEIAEKLNQPMRDSTMRDAFERIAKLRGEKGGDFDLPVGETYSKAVYRSRLQIPLVPSLDKS